MKAESVKEHQAHKAIEAAAKAAKPVKTSQLAYSTRVVCDTMTVHLCRGYGHQLQAGYYDLDSISQTGAYEWLKGKYCGHEPGTSHPPPAPIVPDIQGKNQLRQASERMWVPLYLRQKQRNGLYTVKVIEFKPDVEHPLKVVEHQRMNGKTDIIPTWAYVLRALKPCSSLLCLLRKVSSKLEAMRQSSGMSPGSTVIIWWRMMLQDPTQYLPWSG